MHRHLAGHDYGDVLTVWKHCTAVYRANHSQPLTSFHQDHRPKSNEPMNPCRSLQSQNKSEMKNPHFLEGKQLGIWSYRNFGTFSAEEKSLLQVCFEIR